MTEIGFDDRWYRRGKTGHSAVLDAMTAEMASAQQKSQLGAEIPEMTALYIVQPTALREAGPKRKIIRRGGLSATG